jgi:hypothetical protein
MVKSPNSMTLATMRTFLTTSDHGRKHYGESGARESDHMKPERGNEDWAYLALL